MHFRTLPCTLLFAMLTLALPCSYAQDVQKCTDSEGRVTLTDQPCDGLAPQLLAAEPIPARAQVRDSLSSRHLSLPPQPRRADLRKRFQAPSVFLPRDVATLKAARSAMQVLDAGSAALRGQRLAGYP